MAIEPFKYQKEGILDLEDFLREGGGALLADDMGLGKTLQTLWLLARGRVGNMFPALIICPANVKYTWEYTALEHINVRSQVLEGRTPPQGGFTYTLPPITIINPDILPYWTRYLRKAGFQTLIIDECHQFGNPTSKRTVAAFELARRVPYRIGLSGTPLMNGPSELWPTLYMLRPDIFNSFFAFAEDYCRPKRKRGRMVYTGAKNLDKLHPRLRRTVMVRRLKSQVIKDLPKKVRLVVPMELSDRAEYEFAANDFVGWLRKYYRDDKGRVRKSIRSLAVTRVGHLVRLAARLKARSVVDWANRFLLENPDEKLVLFAVHTKMIELLQRRIEAPHVTVDGSVTGRARRAAVETFRKDPKTRVFLGNIRAAGVGVDGLQDVCNTVGFTEMWWVPGVHNQAEDRVHRLGQDNVAWINYLVAGGTIEEKLCHIIQTKQAVIHATLDGANYEPDMDIFDQLIQIMESPS